RAGLWGVGPRRDDLADVGAVDLAADIVVGQRGRTLHARLDLVQATSAPLGDLEILDRPAVCEVDLDQDVAVLMGAVEVAVGVLGDRVLQEPEPDKCIAGLGVAVQPEVDDRVSSGGAARIGCRERVLDVVLVLDAWTARPAPIADELAILGLAASE